MYNNHSLIIIVPTLNSFKILPRLLNSLKNQTFTDWRLLFIDGPSNDEHLKWLKKCCESDHRINYIKQIDKYKGIYGAMNQGLNYVKPTDWILFWGSDDWVFSKNTLFKINQLLTKYSENKKYPDLIVSKGKYINSKNNKISRKAEFVTSKKVLNRNQYLRSLFMGNIPPHQASIFGPGARVRKPLFNEHFSLAADLDFFLSLTQKNNLKVEIFNQNIVYMDNAGVSSRLFLKRINEVIKSYYKFFNIFFAMPFIFRYLKRIIMKFNFK